MWPPPIGFYSLLLGAPDSVLYAPAGIAFTPNYPIHSSSVIENVIIEKATSWRSGGKTNLSTQLRGR
jgi:hypothetical protein